MSKQEMLEPIYKLNRNNLNQVSLINVRVLKKLMSEVDDLLTKKIQCLTKRSYWIRSVKCCHYCTYLEKKTVSCEALVITDDVVK